VRQWDVPTTRWQVLDDNEDFGARIAADATLLVTWPPTPFERTPTYCFREDGQYWIWQPEVGGVRFTADRAELFYLPLSGTDRGWFQHLVTRSWLPAIYPIWQRQVLHASAVSSSRGEVIAFSGPSGAGKTTTAYALSKRSTWTMVSDDTLAFSCLESGEPVALHPLRNVARLRQSTAEHFGKDQATEEPFDWPPIALGLKCVYALDARVNPRTTVQITPLGIGDSYPLLLGQAHALSLNDPVHNQRLMRDYLTLAAQVPVFCLTYPKRFDNLAMVLDRLEAHARTQGVSLEGPDAGPKTTE
jgi:hypothetical protein